jgi:hypothetical protein
MLGMRGVRLGITVPEIYEMQARAIFEATIRASKAGRPVVPEIMIPLVSARREVELVKRPRRCRRRRRAQRDGQGFRLSPRRHGRNAARRLRAGEIAEHSAFLSFGTNDLTQMTYGLSRDDAGGSCRPMSSRGCSRRTRSTARPRRGGRACCSWAPRADGGAARRDAVDVRRAWRHPDSIGFCRARASTM